MLQNEQDKLPQVKEIVTQGFTNNRTRSTIFDARKTTAVPKSPFDVVNKDYVDKKKSSAVYGGEVSSGGTAVSLPAGWSVSGSGGNYVVTHTLGTSAYNVVATPETQVSAHIPSKSSTIFQVITTDSTGSFASTAFFFIVSLT